MHEALLRPLLLELRLSRSERLICFALKLRSVHPIVTPSREQRTAARFSRTCSPVGLPVGSSTASSARSGRCRSLHRNFLWPLVPLLRSERKQKQPDRANFRPCGRGRLLPLAETFPLVISHASLA